MIPLDLILHPNGAVVSKEMLDACTQLPQTPNIYIYGIDRKSRLKQADFVRFISLLELIDSDPPSFSRVTPLTEEFKQADSDLIGCAFCMFTPGGLDLSFVVFNKADFEQDPEDECEVGFGSTIMYFSRRNTCQDFLGVLPPAGQVWLPGKSAA